MKVSIVVPMYQVEAYVQRCLDSVFAQTYADWELILVDDAATDGAFAFSKVYCANYSGPQAIHFIQHEVNRGVSAARNSGIRQAAGDYLYFLDPDDIIEPSCLDCLVQEALRTQVDVVIADYEVVGDNTTQFPPLRLPEGVLEGAEAIQRSFSYHDWFVMPWNKLIRRDFLLKHQLFFEEGLIHEDDLWSFDVALCLDRMAVLKTKTYAYCVRPASIMTAPKLVRELDVQARILDLMYARLLNRKGYTAWMCRYLMLRSKHVFRDMIRKGASQADLFPLYTRFLSCQLKRQVPMTPIIPRFLQRSPLFLRLGFAYYYRKELKKVNLEIFSSR